MTSGTVFDIRKYSLHDGPGIRTTVFLKGCGLRCQWCHNPESQRPHPELMLFPDRCIRCGACIESCPQGAIHEDGDGLVTDRARCQHCGACAAECYAGARELVGRTLTVAEVMAEIEQDRAFYEESGGGVTFSGGEPLLQGEFLLALLRACRQQDFHTAVDTCGYASTATLKQAIEHTDLFLYDLKLMDDTRHRQATGASNDLILDHLRLLDQRGCRVIVRFPVIPQVTDDDDNIRQIAEFVSILPAVERVDVLAYHRTGSDKYARLGRLNPLPDTLAPTPARLAEIMNILQGYGLQATIGG